MAETNDPLSGFSTNKELSNLLEKSNGSRSAVENIIKKMCNEAIKSNEIESDLMNLDENISSNRDNYPNIGAIEDDEVNNDPILMFESGDIRNENKFHGTENDQNSNYTKFRSFNSEFNKNERYLEMLNLFKSVVKKYGINSNTNQNDKNVFVKNFLSKYEDKYLSLENNPENKINIEKFFEIISEVIVYLLQVT
ncbi:hypothetical protein U3516DRAFT_820342, partial [Neocallimastix sp. 'constans']|jgi:hypothetical protein